MRFYFDIEAIVKNRQMDSSKYETIYQGKTVPAAYTDCYESRLSAAKKMMALFQTINANRELLTR